MKSPSTALLRAFSPFLQPQSTIRWTARGCLAQQQQKATFTSSQQLQKRKGGGPKKDPRISQIRYHLQHPLTPRPLRFSRNRFLRHWTIHRAWQLHQSKLRQSRERELERQYNSMNSACEALRLIDNNGLTEEERGKLGVVQQEDAGKEQGRLFRISMLKHGVWDGIPIEYARIQTESPGREGWNSEWTR